MPLHSSLAIALLALFPLVSLPAAAQVGPDPHLGLENGILDFLVRIENSSIGFGTIIGRIMGGEGLPATSVNPKADPADGALVWVPGTVPAGCTTAKALPELLGFTGKQHIIGLSL